MCPYPWNKIINKPEQLPETSVASSQIPRSLIAQAWRFAPRVAYDVVRMYMIDKYITKSLASQLDADATFWSVSIVISKFKNNN